jgi:protein-L-isoaspartate(D-aspartate) O-methyltransferase
VSRSYRGIGMTSQRTRNRLVERLRSEGITDPAVLEVMGAVPRHIFVDEALASRAYEDTALPIGHSQTISQPYIVARMTELLTAGRRLDRVLEIGTGCGYQTSVLANLVGSVYSVERIDALLRPARERLYALGITNVRMCHADGMKGWLEKAPFDGILVTAAPLSVPDALIEQLSPDGRMIIPVGSRSEQRLMRVTRSADGCETEIIESVSFVPLIGGRD